MSYELNHEQARTAALAAKHSVRTLAQCLTANQREISAEDVAALAVEMREILTSSQTVLHEIERATPDRDTARDVRTTWHCIEDATRALAHSYPIGSAPAPHIEAREPSSSDSGRPGSESCCVTDAP